MYGIPHAMPTLCLTQLHSILSHHMQSTVPTVPHRRLHLTNSQRSRPPLGCLRMPGLHAVLLVPTARPTRHDRRQLLAPTPCWSPVLFQHLNHWHFSWPQRQGLKGSPESSLPPDWADGACVQHHRLHPQVVAHESPIPRVPLLEVRALIHKRSLGVELADHPQHLNHGKICTGLVTTQTLPTFVSRAHALAWETANHAVHPA